MSSKFFEARPLYTGETPYTCTAVIEGSGSIAGETFAGFLYDSAGTERTGAVTVAIADAAARTITATIAAQSVPDTYRLLVRRTDDSSNVVVVKGDLEITDPTKRGN